MDPLREYHAKLVKDEVFCANVIHLRSDREKGGHIQKFQSIRSSEVIENANLHKIRKKLKALPEPLREQVREQYMRNKDVRQRAFQQKQCEMLAGLEKMIRRQTIALGLDYRHFSIGGHEKGLYERMFRIEPSKYMSTAQFLTVMRRVFGFDMSNKTERQLVALFAAFDIEDEDRIDWRAFLYMLALIIQAYEPVRTHLRVAYSIYASSGSLDMECRDKLKLSTIKDIVQVPVILSSRTAIRSLIDDCWFHLVQTDREATKIARAKNAPADPDDLLLSFRLFDKLLTQTDFRVNLEQATVFGKRDKRVQTYVLEDSYYHPAILRIITELRREIRCDNEADVFISRKAKRMKRDCVKMWKDLIRRRLLARRVVVDMYVHWCYVCQGYFFDRWRRVCIEEMQTGVLQRYSRGFIGRIRKRIMMKLQKRAVLVQSAGRKLNAQNQYLRRSKHLFWAAATIQKMYRGLAARRYVRKLVEVKYDRGLRMIERERKLYEHLRHFKAAVRIQGIIRRFVKKMKSLRKFRQQQNAEQLDIDMKMHRSENERKKRIYRQQLEDWYKQRKEEYDRDRLDETQTAAQKSRIIAYRRRIDLYEKEQKEIARLEKNERAEEAAIEIWLESWELKKKERSRLKGIECRHALVSPETPAQRELRKDLLKKIEKQVKVVLRRADKMRIPMEIPEAKEIAREEVIEKEMVNEVVLVEKEMYDAAVAAEKAKEEKRLEEEEQYARQKERMKVWAVTKIQVTARCMISRRILREKTYKRYRKEFDPTVKAYYYVNTCTHATSWDKPKSLGSYDIDAKNHWVPLIDAEGDVYYYNPKYWTMQWKQPQLTVICEVCGPRAFAVARLEKNKKFYCEKHFNDVAAEMLQEGVEGREIRFKSLDGSVQGCSNINFALVPIENWAVHVIHLAEKYSHRVEEAEEQDYSDDEIVGEENGQTTEAIFCSRCETDRAEVKCNMCNVPFCHKCFDRKHKGALWANHTYVEIALEYADDEGGDGEESADAGLETGDDSDYY